MDNLYSLLSGAVISPLLLWAASKIYNNWRLKGTYLTIVGGTGFVHDQGLVLPGLSYTEGLKFGISIRIINATDKVQALEKVVVMWRNVKHKRVKSLRHLIDHDPSIEEYDLKNKSLDELFKRGEKLRKGVLLPLIIEPNGGTVFLRLESNLAFYDTRLFFWLKKIELPGELLKTIFDDLNTGEGIVKVKIDGKVRFYKGIIWPIHKNYNP